MKNVALVLSGGGMNGFSIIGALSYLEQIDYIRKVNVYVGSSFGGMLCILLSLGFSMKFISQVCTHHDFLQCLSAQQIDIGLLWSDKKCILNINSFKNTIDSYIIEKYGKSITLEEAYLLTNKEVTIIGSDIRTHNIAYINRHTYNDMKCIDALLSTIAVPFILPVQQVNEYHFIDGGILNNFPYEYAHQFYDVDMYDMLGICIEPLQKCTSCISDNIIDYAKQVFDLLIYCVFKHQYRVCSDENICVLNFEKQRISFDNILRANGCMHKINEQINEGFEEMKTYVHRLPDNRTSLCYLERRYNDN